jgi:hypothetical protein
MASGNVNRAKRASFQNGPALRQLESAGPLFDCGDLNGRPGNFESKLRSSPWNRHPDRTKRTLVLAAVKVRPGRASSGAITALDEAYKWWRRDADLAST